jgi:uncharacterized protein
VPPVLRVIRKSSSTPQPWKNGGGVTHEVTRVPADGDTFAWRVSVAHIDASGPFSDFAGYDRKMLLLEGEGLELEFADGGRRSLRCPGDLAEFDGALPVHCTLLSGPCVDLNLMVAKAHTVKAGVRRFTPTQNGLDASASCGESTLIFSIDAAIAVTGAGNELVLLEPWDLAVLSNGSVQVTRQESSASSNGSAVFFATVSRGLQCQPA